MWRMGSLLWNFNGARPHRRWDAGAARSSPVTTTYRRRILLGATLQLRGSLLTGPKLLTTQAVGSGWFQVQRGIQ
jgi:hypothetical protein